MKPLLYIETNGFHKKPGNDPNFNLFVIKISYSFNKNRRNLSVKKWYFWPRPPHTSNMRGGLFSFAVSKLFSATKKNDGRRILQIGIEIDFKNSSLPHNMKKHGLTLI